MKIKCDVCGGELEIRLGGKKAKCQVCGMTYSIERLQEKFNKSTQINNGLKLRINKVNGILFSKDCLVSGVLEEGNLRERDLVCLQGTTSPSYKVSFVRRKEYSNEVQVRLINVSKKALSSGQVLVHSFEVDDYFESIIHSAFRGYEVQKNVHIIDGGVDANFMLIKDGQPKLVIILCNSHAYQSKEIVHTMKTCESYGIAVQRYFRDFENERNYVCHRINSVL